MDSFIRTLSLSNEMGVEDIVQPCFKILRWMNLTDETELDYLDVETVFKGAIYINECFALFGSQELLQTLVEHYPFYKHFLEKRVKLLMQYGCMSTICSEIILTKQGQKHKFIVESLQKCSKERFNLTLHINDVTEQLKAIHALEDMPLNRKRLHIVIQKLFQLAVQQIQPAIQRTIDILPFCVLGYTFLEPASSGFLDVCTILGQRICDQLSQCCIPANVVRSLFVLASSCESGKLFYLKCLTNVKFSRSLNVFFVAYLKTIRTIDSKNGEEYITLNNEFKKYGFIDIAFLVYCALLPESPCRVELRKCLFNPNLPPSVVDILNKTILMYD